jgi:hypothetical protein
MAHENASVAMGALAIALAALSAHAQSPLLVGGTRANFGTHALTGGFLPDPTSFAVTSGGSMPVDRLGLALGCRGFVTPQPDVIVHYASPSRFLRIFVRASGDTTLIVNDGAGHWWCDDDSGGALDPSIDLSSPPSGQYDVWVGSHRSSELIRGRLFFTEVR